MRNSSLRTATVRATLAVGSDGSVRDVHVTEAEFRVPEGSGSRIIDKSDPAWNATEIARVTKALVGAFRQWHYAPATLRGEPVPANVPAEMNISRVESRRLN